MSSRRLVAVLSALLCTPSAALAGEWDLTVFLGRAYPVYEERLTLRAPSVPSLPGVEVTPTGTPEITTDGGPVFGAALAWEAGVIGLEGRVDVTEIGFDLTGARYDLRATTPPLTGLTGALAIGDGRFDTERLTLLSLNLRLRTPGPAGVFASGGLSYLPDVAITGSVPVQFEVEGAPALPGFAPQLRLLATPGQSDHRFGVNGGAGIRLGSGRLSLMAEARVFYFKEYGLAFEAENAPGFVNDLLSGLAPVGFEPVIVNAQAGLILRF